MDMMDCMFIAGLLCVSVSFIILSLSLCLRATISITQVSQSGCTYAKIIICSLYYITD